MYKTPKVFEFLRAHRTFAYVLAITLSGAAAYAETGASGQAYGTGLTVAPGSANLHSGHTAVSVLCTATIGASNSNNTAGVSLPSLASTGVTKTSVTYETQGSGTASVAVSDVNTVRLLGGLISADEVKSVSNAIYTSGAFSTSNSGTNLANLSVLGLPILADVGPNTTIALPGIGKVVLNEQTSTVNSTSATFTINAIHVSILQNNTLGLPVGTDLIVAHATSETMATVGLLEGFGYGSSIRAAGTLNSGHTAAITLPCGGTTNGKIDRNSVAGLSIPTVVASGAVHTTAQGSATSTSTSGQITASVAGLNLLNGLVTATVIAADASVTSSGTGLTLSDAGSTFTGLAVSGHPEVGVNPAPNTKISLAGLGTLWLHRVIQKSDSIEVRMIELVVGTDNTLGLPVGADIRVAVAQVGSPN